MIVTHVIDDYNDSVHWNSLKIQESSVSYLYLPCQAPPVERLCCNDSWAWPLLQVTPVIPYHSLVEEHIQQFTVAAAQ